MYKPKTGWAVDGACQPNPGNASYQGKDLETGKLLFIHEFGYATNNIAEFLALVHALALAKQLNYQGDIYTDSITAMSWVRNKKAKTKCDTKRALALVIRAEKWLRTNTYENKIKQWMTNDWGENPADFGHKR